MTRPGSGPQRILVVEDEPDIAALLAYHLTREGYRVETATTGQEGIAAVHRETPDLMVLDLMLPGVSGLDVLRSIRSEAATQDLPVLVLTARREADDRILGFQLGADDYLTKPFSPKELVLRVEAILRRSRQLPVEPGGASPPIARNTRRFLTTSYCPPTSRILFRSTFCCVVSSMFLSVMPSATLVC